MNVAEPLPQLLLHTLRPALEYLTKMDAELVDLLLYDQERLVLMIALHQRP